MLIYTLAMTTRRFALPSAAARVLGLAGLLPFVAGAAALAMLDAPGLRLPQLWAQEQGLAAAFADLDMIAEGCRFGDCAHDSEPGCAVRAAIDAGELDPGRLAGLRDLEEQSAVRTRRW